MEAKIAKDDPAQFPWHIGVFDAHCHPTDTMISIASIPLMKAKVLTIMGTRTEDQGLVGQTADRFGLKSLASCDWTNQERVVPSFGWHPWFSHQMYIESGGSPDDILSGDAKISHYKTVLTPQPKNQCDFNIFLSLPDPQPFSKFINQLRQNLEKYPLALIGEIGLDKSFRIPLAWPPGECRDRDCTHTPGSREGRRLSSYKVSLEHQKKVLTAQLRLAGEFQRAVSIHGVRAHGAVFETLRETWKGHEKKILSKREKKRGSAREKEESIGVSSRETSIKPYPPRVCLHSYTGSPDILKQYFNPTVPIDTYVSFSTTINISTRKGATVQTQENSIRAVPKDRILIESDLHEAGEIMDKYLEDIVRRVCLLRGWTLEEGVSQLAQNWKRFVFGQVD